MLVSLTRRREALVRLTRLATGFLMLGLFAACETEVREPAIPPGREELLSAMLGAGMALPGDCKFVGGGVKHSVVEANYTCASGQVSFELAHPSLAGDRSGAVVTDKFAIVTKQGAPPPELVTALTESVRAREGEFEWTWLGGNTAANESSTPIPIAALAAGALVVIGIAGWMLRRRGA